MPPLQVFPAAFRGGVNDSAPIPQPTDLESLDNFQIYRGRFAVRGGLTSIATITGADQILCMEEHQGKLFIASYDTTSDDVWLHSINPDGTGLTSHGDIWLNVGGVIPRVTMASFTAGSASTEEDRLYISDYDRNQVSRYWTTGTTFTTLSEDLDQDNIKADMTFGIVVDYQYHIWGTGYYNEDQTTVREEVYRFSTPGAIALNDEDGGNNPKEWHFADYKNVGRRGERITSIGFARGRMIVFKEQSCYTIFGFNKDSWAIHKISEGTGCVGPDASTRDVGGWCYFWAPDTGPMRTNGTELVDIGAPIRKLIQEDSEMASDKVIVEFSPADGIVYFAYVPSGGSNPTKLLLFDTVEQRWMTGEWVSQQVGTLGFITTNKTIYMGQRNGGVIASIPVASDGITDDLGSDYTATLKTARLSPAGEAGLCLFRKVAIRVWHDSGFTAVITSYIDEVQSQYFDSGGTKQDQQVSITVATPTTPRESVIEAHIMESGTSIQAELTISSSTASGIVLPELVEIHYIPVRAAASRVYESL